MGLEARKPVLGVCEQQSCSPACASVQTDQRVCYWLFKPHHLKSTGYYGIPSLQKFVLSVCPSVTISFPLSILSIFRPIFFKLYIRVDIGEEWFGIVDG